MSTARADIRRLERVARRERLQIGRLDDLRRLLVESLDAYLLACSRVQLVLVELERAERRSDKEKALELMGQLKAAFAEKTVREKAERKANERYARFTEKLAAERVTREASQGVVQ